MDRYEVQSMIEDVKRDCERKLDDLRYDLERKIESLQSEVNTLQRRTRSSEY